MRIVLEFYTNIWRASEEECHNVMRCEVRIVLGYAKLRTVNSGCGEVRGVTVLTCSGVQSGNKLNVTNCEVLLIMRIEKLEERI